MRLTAKEHAAWDQRKQSALARGEQVALAVLCRTCLPLEVRRDAGCDCGELGAGWVRAHLSAPIFEDDNSRGRPRVLG